MKTKVLVVFGTRPEAIKLAPVISALKNNKFKVKICVTGQHRLLLDQVLEVFGIEPDYDLNIMKDNQRVNIMTSLMFSKLDSVYRRERPDWIFVQGDTTTAFVASLAAFHNHIKVAHIEAGLRTNDKQSPFPEEINRRLISEIADVHFAPTKTAARALVEAGYRNETIFVTGNTVIDSLRYMRDQIKKGGISVELPFDRMIGRYKLILVTAHRRESFGKVFEQICLALSDCVKKHKDIFIVYPVHLNPNVRKAAHRILNAIERIYLTEPMPYPEFIYLFEKAYIVVTDSGGVQEEAAALGKPVVVIRRHTERVEGILKGHSILAGVQRVNITAQIGRLLSDPRLYAKAARPSSIYGDGTAARRIARIFTRLNE